MMAYLYKLCGKLSVVLYLFVLYQIWHLCQYGGLRSHFFKVAAGMAGFLITFLLWLIARKKQKKAEVVNTEKKKILYIEIAVCLGATFLFGGRILYAALPYHGELSWKVEEWLNKKEIPLENTNIYETGVEGILSDLGKKLKLPEELYISNKCQITFDGNGRIQEIYAFLYGKNKDGKEHTYLIDYHAESSNSMTVWTDGAADGKYEESMSLDPMIEILKNADWIRQVQSWEENAGESQVYEILYMGKRSFCSDEGLQYIPGDADGDGVQTGIPYAGQLKNGGELLGYEVSLHMPDNAHIAPVRYIMETEYISQENLSQKNNTQQVEDAKNAERWTVDQRDGTMYFFLDEQKGWRLAVADAAAGSRYYIMEKSVDGGTVWEQINEDPFLGQLGVTEGMLFFDEKFGVIGMTGASQSYSVLYATRDGGASFEKIEIPMNTITELPQTAAEYGITAADYDYFHMPEKEGDVLTITVTTEAAEKEGVVFQSTDVGNTWEYRGIAYS